MKFSHSINIMDKSTFHLSDFCTITIEPSQDLPLIIIGKQNWKTENIENVHITAAEWQELVASSGDFYAAFNKMRRNITENNKDIGHYNRRLSESRMLLLDSFVPTNSVGNGEKKNPIIICALKKYQTRRKFIDDDVKMNTPTVYESPNLYTIAADIAMMPSPQNSTKNSEISLSYGEKSFFMRKDNGFNFNEGEFTRLMDNISIINASYLAMVNSMPTFHLGTSSDLTPVIKYINDFCKNGSFGKRSRLTLVHSSYDIFSAELALLDGSGNDFNDIVLSENSAMNKRKDSPSIDNFSNKR